MNTPTYPYTIDNGAGERLTFVRRTPDPAGDRLEVENVLKRGSSIPMHVHDYQEEGVTVQQGRLGYQWLGGLPAFAGPGETVVFNKGETHRLWNAGDEDYVATGYIQPADNVEYFLTAIFASQRASGNGRPSLFDAAFLARRYQSEYSMVEIPVPIQQFVFPIVTIVGRLLGKYRKYADAPDPVRR